MPNKKKKYNARFPPARIKKIMQTDEDVGKVAAAVPVIISRALEFFIEALIEKSVENTKSKNAKTLSAAHIKQTITSERKFDFLKDLVANIPDIQQCDEEGNYNPDVAQAGPSVVKPAPKKTSSLPGHVPKKRGRPKKIRNEDDEVEKPVKRNCVEIPMSSDEEELESDNEKAESNHERLGTDESGSTTHHMTYLDSNVAASLGSNIAASLGSNVAGSLGSNIAGSLGSNIAGSLGSQFVNLQSAVVTPLYLQSTVKPAETPSALNVPTAMAVDTSNYDENNKTDATNEHAESRSDIKTNKDDSGVDFTTSSGHSCDRDTQEIPKRDLQLADNCKYPSTVLHPISKTEANVSGSVLGQQSIEFGQRRTSVNPDSGSSTNSATHYRGNTDQSHEAQSSKVNNISSQSGGGENYKNTSLQNIHAETPLHKLAAISSLVRLDHQPVSTVTSNELERLQKITPQAMPKQEIRDVNNAAVNSTSSCQNVPEALVNTATESLRVWEKPSQVKCSESSHLLDTTLKKEEPLVSGSDFKQHAGNGDGGSQSTAYLAKNSLAEMQQLINKNTNAIPLTNESFLSASNVNMTQSYYPGGFNTLSPTNNNKLRLMPQDGLLKSAGQVPSTKVTDQWSPTKAGVLDLSVPKDKNNIQVSNNSSESLIDHRVKTVPESHNANNKEQRSQSSAFSNVKATAAPRSTLPEVNRPAGTASAMVGQHGMFAGVPPPAMTGMMAYPPPVMGLPYPVIPSAYAPYPPVNMIPAFHGPTDQIRLGMMTSAFAAQPQPVTSATPGYYLPFPPSTMAGYPAPVTTTNHTNYDSTGKRN